MMCNSFCQSAHSAHGGWLCAAFCGERFTDLVGAGACRAEPKKDDVLLGLEFLAHFVYAVHYFLVKLHEAAFTQACSPAYGRRTTSATRDRVEQGRTDDLALVEHTQHALHRYPSRLGHLLGLQIGVGAQYVADFLKILVFIRLTVCTDRRANPVICLTASRAFLQSRSTYPLTRDNDARHCFT